MSRHDTPWSRAQADLYAEVQRFYAYQMPLLEDRRVDDFADTFTGDGVYAHAKDGWEITGREKLKAEIGAAVPHYGNSVFRHWFDKLLIEPCDENTLRVRLRALVSVTAEDGSVTFEPSSTIEDVLVRIDGLLYTKSRVVRHDIPDPAGYWSEKLAA
ncbi:MAG TPA: nuclear transport factor 2 family protein [Actinocrinis sp.]|jgi:actinorhodin biosynthesis protein ActVIA|uniref:nuclear transport factor 2 family protein n=1 Tax=Actinocrinis sp. TaxID=1920516 RepID=UPI002D47F10E|nr:nuclear transport factor 2 family protein [Actinocrinis sp.]HZU56439.1 nuclear transport factor 2 family protein [Actinocrinis sp.]